MLSTHLFFSFSPLPLLLVLSAHTPALAYGPDTGSAVAGNLSAAAPWGIPPDNFESATRSPDASAAFNITGYNVSESAASPRSAGGWVLAAGVKYDASMADAAASSSSSSSSSSDDNNNVYQATTLYLQTPDGMSLGASWRVCAAVWPGVAAAPANNASSSVDGTCRGVLSTTCQQALVVSGGSGTAGGMDASGECASFALPEGCKGEFPSGTGNVSAVAINQTVLDAKRFYAYGSAPSGGKGNATARDEALRNVWPVVLVYGRLSSGGQLSSTNAAVQCVHAANGTTTDDDLPGSGPGSGAAGRLGLGRGAMSVLAALGTGVIVGWVWMV